VDYFLPGPGGSNGGPMRAPGGDPEVLKGGPGIRGSYRVPSRSGS
jgi:hypothetical protein